MRIFRWKAIVPLVLLLALIVVGWTLYVDLVVRKAIELVGTEVVGAKVELASADVRLVGASVTLRGLQVTNPSAPMTNLVQMDEIVADLNGLALLEKKAVVETVAVRGVRFGTRRAASGALRDAGPTTGLVTRRILGWANSIPIPSLDLSGLTELAGLAGISPDSLRSLAVARAAVARADSARAALERDLRAADPTPVLDSARALAERLRGTDVRRLGVSGLRDATTSVRAVLGRTRATRDRLAALQRDVDRGLDALRATSRELDEARQADYAFAQRLVGAPSLATPDVSMALFGEMAIARMQPVLYWMGIADQYLPPGLRPRARPGPARVRMAGTTVVYPREHTWPSFLLQHGDASLFLGGDNVASGAYRAWVSGVTTEPAVYGRPLRFAAERTAAAAGPRQLRVAGMMDRVGREPHDSIEALLGGVSFPSAVIRPAGARLEWGDGTVRFALDRRGDGIAGTLTMTAAGVTWARLDPAAPLGSPRIGSREWVESVIWRAISSIRDVEVEVRFSGRSDAPTLAVSSNVGGAVSRALQREIGAEIARVQTRARAEVDRVIGAQVAEARARLTALENDVRARLAAQQQQLQDAQAELERRLEELGQVVPGVRLPGIPRIRP